MSGLPSRRPTADAEYDTIRKLAGEVMVARLRQIEKGWTPEHDRKHEPGDLSRAAAVYANKDCLSTEVLEDIWPWQDLWKVLEAPESRRECLLRATAFMMAEIEKLDRREKELNG